MAIPEPIIEEIKARTDLSDVIASYGIALRRAGADYKACCPFHHEKTPSFVVHPNQGYYHCFGCGEKGNVFTFVMKHEGLSFIEAAKKLAQRCGVKIEEKEDPEAGLRSRLYALHAELAAFFRRCLKVAPEAEAARRYLASRDLPEEVAERFCIGYTPLDPAAMVKWAQKYGFSMDEMDAAGVLLKSKYENGRPYNRFGGRLMFTIRDRSGRPVAFSGRILTNEKKAAKYVNSPETLIFKKSNVLFALDQAAGNIVKTPGREAIVCEGQIDVIRCHACGFPTAVASQGTAFTAEHVQILKKVADSVVLVFDADGAGRKAAVRTGGEFLAAEVPVRVATLPPGEDPDSLLRTQGADAFRACLGNSESITHFQVRTMREQEEHPETIDAVARVCRAALETITLCPSAVLRASMMAEVAGMLELPVSALEEDFAKVRAMARAGMTTRPLAAAGKGLPALPGNGDAGRAARPVAAVGNDGTGRAARPVAAADKGLPAQTAGTSSPDEPPEDFYIDSEPPDDIPPVDANQDAAAPQNNPPPPYELALCEFLYDHEGDMELEKLVAMYLPEEVPSHEFTRQFIAAWRAGVYGAKDPMAELRGRLPPAESAWLDAILLGNARSGLSELSPDRILKDMLRRLWTAAVHRRQGQLPFASTPENDQLRLAYSSRARLLQRAPWERASTLMVLSTLGESQPSESSVQS